MDRKPPRAHRARAGSTGRTALRAARAGLAAAAAALIGAACAAPELPEGAARTPVITATASCVGESGELDRVCTLQFGDQTLAVSAIGAGEVLQGAGSGTRFSLPWNSGLTHRIYSAPYHGDLVVLFEVGDEESGWGGIVRLQPPDFHPVWQVEIPSFNVGPGAIDGSSLYLSAVGFVARVDLEAGRYIWQHDDLYDRSNGRFNAFLVPLVTRSEALFYEDVGMQMHKPKVVRVQKDGGALVIEDSE